MQDLVTMGVAAPSRVSGIWLSHSSTQRPIRLWARWRGDDVDRWANRIARTRANYVVHPGLHGNPDGEDLYWKTEAVCTLVVLRLLHECGLQGAALPNRDNSKPMGRLAGRLADRVDRSGER